MTIRSRSTPLMRAMGVKGVKGVMRGIPALMTCALLLLPASSPAINPGNIQAEQQAIKQEQQQGLAGIDRLQQGINQQQQEINRGQRQERDLLAELETLDQRRREQQDKVVVLKEQLATQQELIRRKEGEIGRISIKKQTVLGHLQKRLKAYYTMDKIGAANVAFSSATFPELLSFHDAFGDLLAYDQAIIDGYRATITELEEALTLVDRQKEVLADFILESRREEEEARSIRAEQQQLLTQIRTQTRLHQQAVAEMDRATSNLSASLSGLEKKGKLLEQGFLLNKGLLNPPVSGKILVSFGEAKENRMGIRALSTGIAIQASDGVELKALFEGRVLYGAYLRGYGNTVIIDHSHGYSSLVSRMEKILVKKGQQVHSGQTIGRSGPTATLMEDGILLEIRQGQEPQDPLHWLNPKKLKP